MTDRDLYYCGDFNCDGHARSNERCETIEEATETPTYHTTTFGTKDAKFMVSGNAVYVSRLDAEGNPTGEPMTLSGSLTNIEFTLSDDAEVVEWDQTLRSMTLDLSLNEVDPALLALLTGQGETEFEVWYRKQPWYKRLLWWAQGMWRRLPGVGR